MARTTYAAARKMRPQEGAKAFPVWLTFLDAYVIDH